MEQDCSLTSPIIRKGQIITLSQAFSFQEAFAIRQYADKNKEEYQVAIENLFKSFGIEIQSVNRDFTWRGGVKNILETPEWKIIVDNILVTVRVCITICMGDRRSKIWVRYSSSDEQDEGLCFDNNQMDTFYKTGEQIASGLLANIHKIYIKHILEKYPNIGAPDIYLIDLKAHESKDDLTKNLIGEVKNGRRLREAYKTYRAKNSIRSVLQAFGNQMSAPILGRADNIDDLWDVYPINQSKLIGQTADNGQHGLFLTKVGPSYIKISGFAITPNDTEAKKSASHVTSGILTEHLARFA